MGVVAIIPARGGSKGIKHKNLQQVKGISLIARSVKAALSTPEIDSVYVSTDSQVIAEEAINHGAAIISRPKELARDNSSSESALMHALTVIGDVDLVVFMQCTSPFTQSSSISQAIHLVKQDKYDCVFSATEDHGFRWKLGEHSLEPIGHDLNKRVPRQSLGPMFVETGSFYVFRADKFLSSGSRFHGRIGHVLENKLFAIDVDEPDDLEIARQLSSLVVEPPKSLSFDCVVLDFDGVQTDDYVWINSDGEEFVRVSRSDGLAISLFKSQGIRVLILSSETDGVVSARAKKLGVEVIQGSRDKSDALRQWARKEGVSLTKVAYLGNDVNDLSAMGLVGCPIAVADSDPVIKRIARIVLRSKGGEKAVRELAGLVGDRPLHKQQENYGDR